MKRQYILTIACTLAMAAAAQQLNKEIVIDRDIDPALRAASRITAYPSLVQPKIDSKGLTFSDVTNTVDVPLMIRTLEPAQPSDAIEISPWNGYVALGYFPLYNAEFSAGYRFIRKPDTALGAWLQFDGKKFGSNLDTDDLTRNTVNAAVDFSHIFSGDRRLGLNIDLLYDRLNRPWETGNPTDNNYGLDFNGLWSARINTLKYYIGAETHFFMQDGTDEYFQWEGYPSGSISQFIVNLKGGAEMEWSESLSFGVRVNGDAVRLSANNTIAGNPPVIYRDYPKTLGVGSFVPSLSYRSDMVKASAGVNLQLTYNWGKALHVAPDVRVSVTPSDFLAASVRIGGGEHVNRFSYLHEINPWGARSITYGVSHMPLTAEADILIGPFKGASLKIFGGYASVKDWLMPQIYYLDYVAFSPVDMTAFKLGGEVAWKYGNLLDLHGSYTVTPGSYDHSWYLNPDRAKDVVNVGVNVRPVDRLSVEASLEMRTGRSIWRSWRENGEAEKFNLKDSRQLNLGARYELTPSLSVMARLENILDNRSEMLCLRERQGFTGLVGAELKF